MELNLNDELLKAQKECEDAFAKWNQAQGRLAYVISLIQSQSSPIQEPQNDFEN